MKVADQSEPLSADDEVLILKVPNLAEAVERIDNLKGVSLVDRRCGPHFCAFAVNAPPR